MISCNNLTELDIFVLTLIYNEHALLEKQMIVANEVEMKYKIIAFPWNLNMKSRSRLMPYHAEIFDFDV